DFHTRQLSKPEPIGISPGAWRRASDVHAGPQEPAMMDVIVKSSEHTAARMDFSGLAAIVTGSTSGIGLGSARVFAALGMDVMLNGFGDAAAIEQARAAIEDDFGVTAVYSGADMSKPADIGRMVAEAADRFGKVDVLVNNAG